MDWFRQLMLEDRIYFRSRENLKGIDPAELRPRIVFEGSSAELRKFALAALRRHTDLPPAKRLTEADKYAHSLKTQPEVAQEILHEILDRVGVLSLSASGKSMPIWSSSADRHRGVCVQLNSTVGLFTVALPVEYTDAPPIINRLQDPIQTILQKSLLMKAQDWSFEQEWRIVARWRDLRRLETFILEGQYDRQALPFLRAQDGPGHYSIEPSAIEAVAFGIDTSSEDKLFVRSILAARPSKFRLFQCQLNANNQIEQVEITN